MQHSRNQPSAQLRPQRPRPSLLGTAASAPVVSQRDAASPLLLPEKKKHSALLGMVLQLFFIGLLLEVLYLALYPLLGFVVHTDAVSQQRLSDVLPWRSLLFSPSAFLLAHFPGLDPARGEANRTNTWLFALILAFLLLLLAVRVGSQLRRAHLSQGAQRWLLGCVLFFAALFSATMVFAPLTNTVLTQDLLLSGLYGRMVALYHVNPYVTTPTVFAQDFFQQALKTRQVASFGPVWIDISMLATLFAQNNLAKELLTFRLIGLVAHLLNCFFLWAILGQIKPEQRFSTVLLYAWNPLFLLLGVAQPHQELVLILFLLLSVFFFAHNGFLQGWIFLLLAVLCNLLYLLLVPIFVMILVKRSRLFSAGRRFLGLFGMMAVAGLVAVLVYLPYWPGWGIQGAMQNVLQDFLPNTAQNSLDSALLHLPAPLPAPLLWILAPHHWAAASLIVIGCFLLFSLWLADTLEMVLFFTSWLMLLAVFLLPVYWPWYVLVPLVLALASANNRTHALVLVLIPGALLCYYFLQWQAIWSGLALVCLGLPVVLWGWAFFFSSTWQMLRTKEEAISQPGGPRIFSRPPWLSRPSWPGNRR
jgi:hypothetical protein